MNWDDARVFLAVARAGQFVAAARSLKVDHATVARRITALEKALNARLVDRRTTGVLLTGAGTRFLASAEKMETSVLLAQAELTDRDVELSGTVRVGAPDGLAAYYLAGRFAAFTERHHDPARSRPAGRPVKPPRGRHRRRSRKAGHRPLRGAQAHRLRARALCVGRLPDPKSRSDAPRRPRGTYHRRLCRGVQLLAGPRLHRRALRRGPVRFQCASAVGQLEAVRAGVGIGALHDFIARRHPDLVRVLPAGGANRSYWLVEHEDTRGIGRIRAVHDFLVHAVEHDRMDFARRR